MARRILLMTVGETPPLVTETLYALATERNWWPNELILVTTKSGRTLFETGAGRYPTPVLYASKGSAPTGRLVELCAALGRADDVPIVRYIVPQRNGVDCEDIRTDEEVSAFAEKFFSTVRELTSDRSNHLHVSIAGGRKTMSYIAGQVMTLCARPSDSLSHVLVEPVKYEGPASNFWWPTPGESDDAKVLLHDVPLLRLGAWLSINEVFRDRDLPYRDAINRANESLEANLLVVDLVGADNALVVNGERIRLDNTQAAILAMISVVAKMRATLSFQDEGWHKKLALNGDAVAGTALLSWLVAAARLEKTYNADGSEKNSFALFDIDREAEIQGFHYQGRVREPVTEIRGKLKKVGIPRSLAIKVIRPGRNLPPATAFAGDEIRLRLPAFLGTHALRPQCPDIEWA